MQWWHSLIFSRTNLIHNHSSHSDSDTVPPSCDCWEREIPFRVSVMTIPPFFFLALPQPHSIFTAEQKGIYG